MLENITHSPKTCARCKISKPLDAFGKDKNKRDGRNKYCLECRRIEYWQNREANVANMRERYATRKEEYSKRAKAWHAKNPNYSKEQKKRYYYANREKCISYSTEWGKKNKEKINAWSSRWKSDHPEKRNEYEQRRRARMRGNTSEKIDLRFVYERDKFTCQICGYGPLSGNTLTIDHIIPVSKGGAHTYENVRVACRSCNCRKGNRV